MAQKKNITNITGTTTGTGLTVPFALSGFTYTSAPLSEQWPGSASTGYLVQTNDGVACSVTIDNTSGADAPFSGGTGTPNKYHRASFWVRPRRTDMDLTTPSAATLLSFSSSVGGFTYTGQVRAVAIAPASPNSTQKATQSGICLHTYTPSAAGPLGSYGNTECGYCRNASGVFYAGTSPPSGGTYVTSFPTLPYDVWSRVDVALDDTGTFSLSINGNIIGYFDFTNAISTGSAPYPQNWAITFPAWTGIRWELGAMSSWDDTAYFLDTGMTLLNPQYFNKLWGFSPSFPGGRVASERLVVIPTNCTYTSIPYSVASGNRPGRERGRFTSTSTSGVFGVVTLHKTTPTNIVFNDDDSHTVVWALRFEHDTWTGSISFNGLSLPDFSISGASGTMTMTDSAGKVIATWAIHDQVFIFFNFPRSGGCRVTTYNNSKDFAPSGLVNLATGATATLNAVTDLSTTFDFYASFSTTTNGSSMEWEQLEDYKYPTLTLVDSYEEASVFGYGGGDGYTYSTFGTAPRRALNYSSLFGFALTGSDGSAAGGVQIPSGPNMPQSAAPIALGRSGKKMTDWPTACLSGLTQAFCWDVWLIGGFANNMGSTSTAQSQATAASLATAISSTARWFLDRDGYFTWVRPTFPNIQPNNSYPAAPFNASNAWECFVLSIQAVTTALQTLQKNHPRGARLTIADPGIPEFEDGLHWGTVGSIQALVNAGPQIAFNQGTSRADTADIPGGSTQRAATRRRIVPIPVSQ